MGPPVVYSVALGAGTYTPPFYLRFYTYILLLLALRLIDDIGPKYMYV